MLPRFNTFEVNSTTTRSENAQPRSPAQRNGEKGSAWNSKNSNIRKKKQKLNLTVSWRKRQLCRSKMSNRFRDNTINFVQISKDSCEWTSKRGWSLSRTISGHRREKSSISRRQWKRRLRESTTLWRKQQKKIKEVQSSFKDATSEGFSATRRVHSKDRRIGAQGTSPQQSSRGFAWIRRRFNVSFSATRENKRSYSETKGSHDSRENQGIWSEVPRSNRITRELLQR